MLLSFDGVHGVLLAPETYFMECRLVQWPRPTGTWDKAMVKAGGGWMSKGSKLFVGQKRVRTELKSRTDAEDPVVI